MKTSVYIATSLDGYIARENGDLDWLPGADGEDAESAEDYGYQKFMDSVDVLIMGRKTYEKVLSFGPWPHGEKRVIVLSGGSINIPENISTTVETSSASPQELVKTLSAQGASHLYIDGGKTIQGFLSAGLIDELIITTMPILIGSGISLFGYLDHDIALTHQSTREFGAGFVQSNYGVVNGS